MGGLGMVQSMCKSIQSCGAAAGGAGLAGKKQQEFESGGRQTDRDS